MKSTLDEPYGVQLVPQTSRYHPCQPYHLATGTVHHLCERRLSPSLCLEPANSLRPEPAGPRITINTEILWDLPVPQRVPGQ